MEEGVLYGPESVNDVNLPTLFQQVGWMSGNQVQRERPGAWIFKGGIVNQRRKLIAWRCTSCDAVELIAAFSLQDIRVGDVYNGRVTSIEHFGAFVELLPGRQGLCHISELDDRYVSKVEEVVSVGEDIQVKVVSIDAYGNIKLSRKAALREQP